MSMVNVKNLGFGGTGIPDALPQAIAELQGMRLTVVSGAAAGTVVPVPGMDPEDTIGAACDLTGLVDIDPTTLSIQGRNAFATITCLATAVDGDSVTVNGKKYTFKDIIVSTSYNAPPGVVPTDITPSGSHPEDMAAKLSKAIMSGDSTLTATVGLDTSSPPLKAKITVKVRQPGTAGNSVTLSELGNAVTVSGANFTGGTAAGSAGFVSSVSLAGKKILLLWYDKHPGVATAPLLMALAHSIESPYELMVDSLDPASAEIGEPSFTLHVHGAGFGPQSKIMFNGYEEPTTFVSYTELTTGVNMDVWHGPSEPLPVKVRTEFGDDSNEVMFQFFAEGAGSPPDSPPEGGSSRRSPSVGGPGGVGGPGNPGNLNIKAPRKPGR